MTAIVRKSSIHVEIGRIGRPPVQGSLFLRTSGRTGAPPETLSQLLNGSEERMLPFERRSDGATLLIARTQLTWVRALDGSDARNRKRDGDRPTREELVRVSFLGGVDIEGLLLMELQGMCDRASDFINGSEAFFPLLTSGGLCHVNKETVLEVRVFELSPLPPLPEVSR